MVQLSNLEQRQKARDERTQYQEAGDYAWAHAKRFPTMFFRYYAKERNWPNATTRQLQQKFIDPDGHTEHWVTVPTVTE